MATATATATKAPANSKADKKPFNKRLPKPDKHAFDVELATLETELKEKIAVAVSINV